MFASITAAYLVERNVQKDQTARNIDPAAVITLSYKPLTLGIGLNNVGPFQQIKVYCEPVDVTGDGKEDCAFRDYESKLVYILRRDPLTRKLELMEVPNPAPKTNTFK